MRTIPCWGNLRHDLRTHGDAGNPDEPKSLRKTWAWTRGRHLRGTVHYTIKHALIFPP